MQASLIFTRKTKASIEMNSIYLETISVTLAEQKSRGQTFFFILDHCM